MRRDYVGLWSPAIGAEGGLLAYGHHGRPLLAFQSEQGRCSDYEDRGMIDAIADLIGAGRVKVYSVDTFHAANFAFRRADLFPLAICQSGVYDAARFGWGERGDAVYFNNPMDYVANLHGDHLQWLRGRLWLLLVCGQGQWEDTTGALESTRAFDRLLGDKAIPHETDLWGHDVPHDWPSWRAQLAHHLPRFV